MSRKTTAAEMLRAAVGEIAHLRRVVNEAVEVLSTVEPPAPADTVTSDLVARLRQRALVEAPSGYDQHEEPPEITWGEMAEVSALLTEAADALAARTPAEGTEG